MINSKRTGILLLLFLLFTASSTLAVTNATNLKNIKVLVYTKNGEGFVHDNIPSAVSALQKLGVEHKFKVDVSDDPAVFTEENLKQYTLLIFPSTNNDVFDTDQQRLAFRRYIQAGGGLVGIHSITGTERNWHWFKQFIGGTFSWHATNQRFTAKVIKPEHPSIKGVPKIWERHDECYFTKELYPGIEVLMAHDLTSLNPNEEDKIKVFSAPFGNLYPAVWCQKFDGGNMWLTTFGHDKESYEDAVFMQHVLQGIKYIASLSKKLDYNKAYATFKDDPVHY